MRALVLSVLSLSAVLLSACGGDGGGADPGSTPAGTPAAPLAATTPTPAPGAAADGATNGATVTPSPAVTPTPLGLGMPLPDPAAQGQVHRYFKITVTDASTGKPVSGAQLTTTAQQVFTSDNNGVIAFYEPGLMDQDVWFSVTRNGYDIAADGLGQKGARLHAVEGGSASVALTPSGTPAKIDAGDQQTRLAQGNVPGAAQCLAVRVFDKQNNRGVPLAILSNSNGSYLSDSQGMIAYCDPDHLGAQDFTLSSDGYSYSGGVVHLNAVGGQQVQLGLDRQNVAERLYRTTGQGIDRDSTLLGLGTPLRNPNLNAQVTGQDSVITALYKGKIFWTWGDTNNSAYALGQFSTSGALSDLPANGGLSPDLGLNQSYYSRGGFSKRMVADMTPANTPIWVGALIAVPDAQGTEHLFAGFVKNAQTDAQGNVQVPARHGLLQFNDATNTFEPVINDYASNKNNYPGGGEAFRFSNPDQDYAYFGSSLRIPAQASAMLDPTRYQVFTAFKADGSLQQSGGVLSFGWAAGGQLSPTTLADVRAAGLDDGQALDGHLRDAATGANVTPVAAAISWNAYRHRFVLVANRQYALGEVWYAEADTPMGPWVDARKVLTHSGYTFYNPYLHPYLSPDNGRTQYLEGTYTMAFSSATVPTPRYNYNQLMYRLNSDDPALVLPVPIYDLGGNQPGRFVTKRGLPANPGNLAAPFLAPDRPAPGTQAFGFTSSLCTAGQKLALGSAVVTPMFYALPASGTHPAASVPLYEFLNGSGQYAYSVASSLSGYSRSANAVAYVWSNPIKVKLPVGDYQGGAANPSGADACVAH